MSILLQQIGLNLRLNLRNRMALIYGYLFPLIFLIAFWTIYRNDRVPLVLHMGELLTITVLGGSCFGLPTTMVNERERGVWRRYRLSPVPAGVFVAGTLITRYILLLTAALLQILLAMLIGMPALHHPFSLLLAFTFASIAFLGLGMVIAMLADTVPAVQALGQCIFLPMLMIGGVAVPLSSLPRWALHVSAFLPGRYAVEAIQLCTTSNGLSRAHFDLFALLLIGVAGSITAAMIFRWGANERFVSRRGTLWIALALGVWIVVGLLAESNDRINISDTVDNESMSPTDYVSLTSPPSPFPAPVATPVAPQSSVVQQPHPARSAANNSPSPERPTGPSSWQVVTQYDIDGIAFERLPPDEGLISPIAHSGESPDPTVADQLEQIRTAFATWPAAMVSDPVQRARNDLDVAAVPDVLQMGEVERFIPLLVFSRLRKDIPAPDLPKILYWIAMHPEDGDDSAMQKLEPFGLPSVTGPTHEVHSRVMLYSLKLLGRLTGKISPK
jgi:hypothetical protein